MADLKLFTDRNCGWAVRNYAALIEKRVNFDTIPVSGKNGQKSPGFLLATPYGLTPVLVHGDVTVFESTLINDYIDDCFPKPRLMPSDPAGRIEVRKWIHFCKVSLFRSLIKIVRGKANEDKDEAADSFRTDLDWFADNVLNDGWRGPYFAGEQFTLVDIVFHTLFITARELEGSNDERIQMTHDRLREWRSNIDARPSIQQALEIQERIPF